MKAPSPRIGLFVTCLVDLFRPSVGFASLKLLEDAGCVVEVPEAQTCCGQPAYNSGDRGDAKAVARGVIAAFEPYDYLVAPSGSCTGMIKKHYPELFSDEPEWRTRAERLAGKSYELVSFLTDVLGVTAVPARHEGSVTYHDSCSGLRELGVRQQPRRLLATVDGLTLKELPDADVCCGFGGTFCVKYPDISNAIVEKKTASIAATGRGDAACRRPRLPHEHGRQAEAGGPPDQEPPRRRGARRDDAGAGDRRGQRMTAIAKGAASDADACRPSRRSPQLTPVGPATARDGAELYDTCFARAYDAAHLEAHPGQRVTAMQVFFQEFEDNLWAGVYYTLRDGKKYAFTGDCYDEVDGGFLCHVCANDSCDQTGETFKVLWSGRQQRWISSTIRPALSART